MAKEVFFSKKFCRLCRDQVEVLDYKDTKFLQRYISHYGKIEPRKRSGNCMKHQRLVTRALKRARQMALLPYLAR